MAHSFTLARIDESWRMLTGAEDSSSINTKGSSCRHVALYGPQVRGRVSKTAPLAAGRGTAEHLHFVGAAPARGRTRADSASRQ